MSPRQADPAAVVAELERARGRLAGGAAAVAFDADGTLWSGDVGEDVWDFACEHELLRDAAAVELRREAEAHAIGSEGSPSRVAARLFDGYRRGIVEERRMCEIMTWAYAGHTPEELAGIARRAFDERRLVERRHAQLGPIFDWAEREGVRTVVISASPRIIVEEALRTVGVRVAALAAATPRIEGGVIAPGLAGPIPYAHQKTVVGGELLAGHDWLASFGDNVFDLEMLRIAKVAVAVCPKPALAARLAEVPGVLVLD